MAPWSMDTTPSRPETEPWISELLPDPATPVTTTSTPSGMSTSTACRLFSVAPRISRAPVGVRTASFSTARSSRWRPVSVPLARRSAIVPSNTTSPPPEPAPRTEVDDVVGDHDGLGLVLDDEHRVALVAQLQQQVVHPLDVVRMQSDRGLVEDVRDIRERGAEVADHLRALRLAARQRAGRAVEGEVPEADLDERVEDLPQRRPAAGRRRARRARAIQSARSLICIAHASAMLIPSIFDERAPSFSRVPPHSGQAVKATAR